MNWSEGCPELDGLLLAGTYTVQGSRGIYGWRFRSAPSPVEPLGLIAETPHPSWIVVHPNRKFIYAVSEFDESGSSAGSLSAFAFDARAGAATLLNRAASGGRNPCHLALDASGRMLLAANYGGVVASFPILEDGRIGPMSAAVEHRGSSAHAERQRGAHPHSVTVAPGNGAMVVADLGLDRLLIYRLNLDRGAFETGDPHSAPVPAGAGPRHFVFHPNGKFGYVVNELVSTIVAFSFDAGRRLLNAFQTVATVPPGFEAAANWASGIAVHPNGTALYASNRGHDSIAIFGIDRDGALRPAGHVSSGGTTPRSFEIDACGRYLFAANQDSGTIAIFRIDRAGTALTPAGSPLPVTLPACVRFIPERAPANGN